MNKLQQKLRYIKQRKRLGLMTHVVVGYPSLSKTESLVKVMEEAGADFIELQIPFSDPLADGPTIMRACEKALENRVKVKDAFTLANKLSKQVKIPLLFMAYYNTVFKYGTKKFCLDAKKAGISGLIVPDMPLEEEEEEHFMRYCRESGLYHIRVISPSSTAERLKKNAKVARGFVYCTARQGITGAKKELDPKLTSFLKNVRIYFNIPIAVGFGIGSRERFKQIKPLADIAVIGSAIIDIISSSSAKNMEQKVKLFLSKIF